MHGVKMDLNAPRVTKNNVGAKYSKSVPSPYFCL
jgi:hypothetical protein